MILLTNVTLERRPTNTDLVVGVQSKTQGVERP